MQYNVRGQLWDVRVSTGADVNGTWNRGVLQFFYDQTYSYGASGADNNGNVLAAKYYRPLDDSSATWAISTDYYSYDALNRLTSVSENFVSSSQAESLQFVQRVTFTTATGIGRLIKPTLRATGSTRKTSPLVQPITGWACPAAKSER